jgi:hypothetical protein
MTLSLAIPTALFLAALAIFAAAILISRQIATMQRRCSGSFHWTGDLSVERYRPMLRLLNGDDFRFLRTQPGVTPALINRLRKQRCQVFRGYLRCLQEDFALASDALIMVMVQSQSDRRDLIPTLIGSRLKFAAAIFRVRCRLVLYRWNVGQVPVARLVHLFEVLQLELLASTPTEDGHAA